MILDACLRKTPYQAHFLFPLKECKLKLYKILLYYDMLWKHIFVNNKLTCENTKYVKAYNVFNITLKYLLLKLHFQIDNST